MNLIARAARQLQALDASQAACILDTLERQPPAAGTTIIRIDLERQAFRCLVGRHRDGCRVLLGIVPDRKGDRS